MLLTIHRGTANIGGNTVELECDGTRIMIDFGMPLFDEKGGPFDQDAALKKTSEELLSEGILPRIKGLYYHVGRQKQAREKKLDAIFLSHAHPDHYGLLSFADASIPLYMSAGTERILSVSGQYLKDGKRLREWRARLGKTKALKKFNGDEIHRVGPFKVTPVRVNHSAHDAFAFLIEVDGMKIFYTGDLRGHGRQTSVSSWKELNAFLKKEAPIDYMICEGTHLSRDDGSKHLTESDVEKECARLLKNTAGLALLQFSSINVDRLASFISAAFSAGRTMVLDLYAAYVLYQITTAKRTFTGRGKTDLPSWTDDRFRIYAGNQKDRTPRKAVEKFAQKKKMITIEEINKNPGGYVAIARPTYWPLPEFRKLNFDKGVLVFSMWKGYEKTKDNVSFTKNLSDRGMKKVFLHSSGHIYKPDLKKLIESANPKTLIPIHTQNPKGFKDIIPSNTILLRAKDGQMLELNSSGN